MTTQSGACVLSTTIFCWERQPQPDAVSKKGSTSIARETQASARCAGGYYCSSQGSRCQQQFGNCSSYRPTTTSITWIGSAIATSSTTTSSTTSSKCNGPLPTQDARATNLLTTPGTCASTTPSSSSIASSSTSKGTATTTAHRCHMQWWQIQLPDSLGPLDTAKHLLGL